MVRTAGSSGEKTAKAIERAAVRLFAERGYAAVSMRAIAEHVGIQVGALYNHFATKQDILLAIMMDHLEELLGEWEELYDEAVDPLVNLETFVRFHVRYHMNRHDDVFISFMELRSLEDENFQKIEALRKRYEYQIRDILERGRCAGLFVLHDAHVSAMAFLAMLTGVTNWFRPDGRLTGDEIEDIYLSMVFQAVGHVRETARIKEVI